MDKANIGNFFKLLEWTSYLCLCIFSFTFIWQVLKQYQSKDTSFKEYEESIDKSPTLVFCFSPHEKKKHSEDTNTSILELDSSKKQWYVPYILGRDFNTSLFHWSHDDFKEVDEIKLGTNTFTEDEYHRQLILELNELKTMYFGTCYQLFSRTINIGWRIYIGFSFNKNLEKVPAIDAYVTSLENSYGVTYDTWNDGEELAKKSISKVGGIKLRFKKRKYLKDGIRCSEQSFYQCFAERIEQADFGNCPRKCTHISLDGSELPYCNTLDEADCAGKAIAKTWNNITSEECRKPCEIYEFQEKGAWQDKSRDHDGFLFSYEFLKNEKTKTSEEYLIYDTVGLIGSVGGTLGMFTGFTFSNTISIVLKTFHNFFKDK